MSEPIDTATGAGAFFTDPLILADAQRHALAEMQADESGSGWSLTPGCGCFRCLRERIANPDDHGARTIYARMIVCPTCGNKRCPHATDHMFACTASNAPGQVGSRYRFEGQFLPPTVDQVRHAELQRHAIERLRDELEAECNLLAAKFRNKQAASLVWLMLLTRELQQARGGVLPDDIDTSEVENVTL